jgi:histidinol phosphatase-like enzyme (inositol monophosphatase family)
MSGRDQYHLELEGFALELGHMAGGIAKAYFRSAFSVENKDPQGFDPVTSADRAIEKVLREAIREAYPGHGIVAEEFGNELYAAAFKWFIDPIDGTRSFLMGSPLWGTLVGLTENDVPLVGLLIQPVLAEVFLGSQSGSWLIREDSRERLHTSKCKSLSRAKLTSTHPDMFKPDALAAFGRVSKACLLTRYGGDCYNYAMLAAGFVDLVVEADLKPFDIVPLIPIIESAGGVVTDWTGSPALAGGYIVAAANAELHAETIATLNR